jgi:guanylate kinase
MRPTIIAIVGDSGAGKTFASMFLQDTFEWKAIVSYTTRPMRKGEIQGREHHFVTEDDMPCYDEMCAYTYFGGYHYWTTWDQIFNNKHQTFVYVIDEKGLMMLQSHPAHVAYNVLSVKILRDNKQNIDQERLGRDTERAFIPITCYDHLVDNNGTLEQFKNALYDLGEVITETINNKNNGSTNE